MSSLRILQSIRCYGTGRLLFSTRQMSIFTQLAEIPIPTGAQFLGDNRIELSFVARDHTRNVKRSLLKQVVVSPDGEVTALPAQEVNYVASRYSPSGRTRAVLREVKDGSTAKYFVELWADDRLMHEVDVTDNHDKFYADEYIGTLSFSQDENSLVYTAEALVENDDTDPYAKWRYKPDLGEGLSGKRRPAAFIVHWDDSNVTVSRIVAPDHLYLGQHIFSPFSPNTLFASAYELQPDGRLLGVKGCFNRARGIWRVDLDSERYPDKWNASLTKLTEADVSCRSPRVIGDQLVWLSESVAGSHASAATVDTLNLRTNETRTVLDVVEKPLEDGFPGLYAPAIFPSSLVVSSDSKAHVAVQSTYGSRTLVGLVSLDGGYKVLELDQGFSWNVLATDGKSRIVCSRSTPATPYEIVLVDLADGNSVKVIDSPALADDVAKALASIKTQVIETPGREPTETIVIQSTSNEKVAPCVLVPHGGPHATSTTAFSAGTTALVLEGYTLALVNYTGSLGFGEAATKALLGRCGRLDVDDCIASLEHIIKLGIAQDGPGRLFVQGGSHGGFLTAHLIGQFPDRFTAASMRNPVISGGETIGTDIPEWYYLEFGRNYPIQSSAKSTTLSSSGNWSSSSASNSVPPLMTGKVYDEFQHASPMHYVDAVKTPMLMLVGLSDRRVAPTQGIEYYHALKARAQDKRKVDMLVFEGESHPMDGVECMRVSWEAARDWYAKAKDGKW